LTESEVSDLKIPGHGENIDGVYSFHVFDAHLEQLMPSLVISNNWNAEQANSVEPQGYNSPRCQYGRLLPGATAVSTCEFIPFWTG
jgi:hypothetical protein